MSYSSKVLKLYFSKGTSDKEYHIVIEAMAGGYRVYGLNGRRGNATTLQTKASGPVSLRAAEAAFHAVVEEKRKKQYTTDWSGRPGAGIDFSAAIISGTAPASVVSPVMTAMEAEHLVPAPWLGSGPDIDEALLSGESGTSAQLLPAGERLMALATVGNPLVVSADDGKPGFLPKDVLDELEAALPQYVLDGCYAAGTFVICDGYSLKDTAAGQGAPFADRIRSIEAGLRRRKLAPSHVMLQQVFFDSDIPQGVYMLAKPGSDVLVRRNHLPYQRAAATNAAEAYVCRLTVD
ncbi:MULTISPECIES: hypothetical protein [unclassified Variovorax]|nr:MULTISPECIES: hypothetical protein [unclassified Variovorax]KWT98476.1 hypothetical protein APY03_0611 [Variovorax sp. WDL1]PNG49849.1 hypothetical protein CHC06_05430 [Variovorax sp. B2]PNG50721.1 hypothetical protein CHC07_05335 [Variovorax sp. B4]VTU42330.1 hypothetical protein H6P1_00159 [Variovorax sp. PBL-H6]VTU44050.1 hypothetical protein SRS16P1_00743 [Variovorax sp. SRS16]